MVSATARHHGISTGQLFTWRRLAREVRSDVVSGFAPAVILDEAPVASRGAGVMEISVRDARIVVTAVSAELQCADITVSPGGAPVLRRLSLHAPAGSRTALVGPSGAGKTTLLRAICGLAPLDGGDIRLGGRSLRCVPAHRRGIAIVFQEPRLLPHLSVVDNVALGLRAAGVARASKQTRKSSPSIAPTLGSPSAVSA